MIHKYVWALDKRARRHLPVSLPYPKFTRHRTERGVRLTPAERGLLLRLHAKRGGMFVRGADVRTARRLDGFGLVALIDNGAFRGGPRGNYDRERWDAEITELGREVLLKGLEAVEIDRRNGA